MIDPARVAVVLLAAGLSRRFGESDKLASPVAGLALGRHAARMLGGFPFAARIAVTGEVAPDYEADGFVRIVNDAAASGQGSSIRLGIAEARRHDIDAILIALADMPLVPKDHVAALLALHSGSASIVASKTDHPGPPALFGRDWFDTLASLEGDRGAAALLARAVLVPCSGRALLDVDTPADLAGAFPETG